VKATKEQHEFIRSAIYRALDDVSKNPTGLKPHDLGDGSLWRCLVDALNNPLLDAHRPFKHGTNRSWKLAGLNDSHIVTVFNKIRRESERTANQIGLPL
jgi:hypothetical protein